MSIEDFDSRWEYSKSTSNYHFDPTVDEDANPPFKRLGRFVGDWAGEMERAFRAVPHQNGFLNRLRHAEPYTARLDRNDLAAMGVPEDWVLFDKYLVPATARKLRKMAELLGMEGSHITLHCQRPGQVFFYHIDDLTSIRQNRGESDLLKDPSSVARFGIALQDWVPGHVYSFGNTYWKQWRAGDIVWHDWINVPHGTANLAHTPRITMQVTGFVTERTREILAEGIGEVII